MMISKDIRYVGVNDHQLDLFEGQYPVLNGISYNSYVVLDEKTAVMDSVEERFAQEWLDKIRQVLGDRSPDYLIVQHMEPDHSSSITAFLEVYPHAVIVATTRAFTMMKNFFGVEYCSQGMVVGEGDKLSLGRHTLTFFTAPMVHWPEVMVTYDERDKVLFSADAFGKFGALDVEEDWVDEARRYYIGIVGKYGVPTQALLKKAARLELCAICPLHGPVLRDDLERCLDLYQIWASYQAETDGVVIAYTSVYGHTRQAVDLLADTLRERGYSQVVVHDLARCDMSAAVADTFRYSKLVLATTTYNGDVFPNMKEFIHHLTERGYRNRTVALVENGSWAPQAARIMKSMMAGSENLTFADTTVTLRSALNDDSREQLLALAETLCREKRDFFGQGQKQSEKKRYVCKICGWIYEGEKLPADLVCPVCCRGAEDFALLE